MKLKDILPDYPIENISVRTTDPHGDDMLFGICHWTGTELISGDGDNYYIDEEISKHEFSENGKKLTYWIECKCMNGKELNAFLEEMRKKRKNEN